MTEDSPNEDRNSNHGGYWAGESIIGQRDPESGVIILLSVTVFLNPPLLELLPRVIIFSRPRTRVFVPLYMLALSFLSANVIKSFC